MKKIISYTFMALMAVLSCSAQETQTPLFRIGIVTDIHHSATKEATPERNYQASAGKLKEAAETFNNEKVDMVVSLGDLVDNESGSYSLIADSFNSLKMPVYKILGNHDHMVPFSQDAQDRILEMMGIEEAYFSVKINGYRLLFLNTSDVSTHGNEKGSEAYIEANTIFKELKEQEAPNAKRYNGAIGGAQLSWMKKELKAAEKAGEKVICLMHIPIMPEGGKYTLWNADEILWMLKKHPCVKAVFSGHDHRGGYKSGDNMHFLTFCGLVQGESNSFAIVDVYPDKLVVNGYGRETNRELEHLR